MDSIAEPHVTKHTLPPRLAYADGVVYASQGKLYALDASDGRLVREYDIRVDMDLTVVAGVIYAGSTARNEDGEYAFAYQATSVESGARIWSAPVHGRPYYAPLVIGDTALVAVVEGTLYALNRATGAMRWRNRSDGWLAAAPVVSDDALYFSPVVNDPEPAFVYALDKASGWRLWRTGLPATTRERLAVHGGALYAAMPNGGGLIALDRRGGARLWWQPPVAAPLSAPVTTDDAVYLICSRTVFDPNAWADSADDDGALPDLYVRSAVLVAMRVEGGALLWERTIGAEGRVTYAGEPIATGALVYVGANDGALYAFDPTTGALRWRFQTGGDTLSTPVLAGDSVYIGASDAYVYALDAATGEPHWRVFTSTDVYGVARVSIGRLHIGDVKRADGIE